MENAAKTLILAGVSLGLAFHWIAWDDAQSAAVLGVVAAVFVLISAVTAAVVRQKVTPVTAPRSANGLKLAETPQ